MKAIHAILAAVKAVLHTLGLKRAEAVVETVDKAATTVEDVIAAVQVHAADGNTVAFLVTPPDMSYGIFKAYADALRNSFAKDRAASGVAMPRVIILPPGMTVEVVKEKAAQLEAAALSGGAA